MKRILFCFIIILVLQFFTPFWWWIMAVPFFYCLIKANSAWEGFRTGAFSAGLLWLAYSSYLYFNGSEIIVSRVSNMIQLETEWLLIIVTALIAAFAAGISGIVGFGFKTVLKQK